MLGVPTCITIDFKNDSLPAKCFLVKLGIWNIRHKVNLYEGDIHGYSFYE